MRGANRAVLYRGAAEAVRAGWNQAPSIVRLTGSRWPDDEIDCEAGQHKIALRLAWCLHVPGDAVHDILIARCAEHERVFWTVWEPF